MELDAGSGALDHAGARWRIGRPEPKPERSCLSMLQHAGELRVRLISPEQVDAQLGSRFSLLGARSQRSSKVRPSQRISLRPAVVDWITPRTVRLTPVVSACYSSTAVCSGCAMV